MEMAYAPITIKQAQYEITVDQNKSAAQVGLKLENKGQLNQVLD